jgi:hypothetical protein
MAAPDPTRLLFDGIRLILQTLVEVEVDRVPQHQMHEIQDWYDRCYRLLEGKEPPE